MGNVRRKLRVTRRRGSSLACLLVAALLGWCSVALLLVRTPDGIHCPTAPVQAVLVPVKDCCDRIVGYETRKPQVGEELFKQCRCAEKRTAQQTSSESSNPQIEMPPVSAFVLVIPEPLPEPQAEHRYFARLTVVPSPPSIRPPCFA